MTRPADLDVSDALDNLVNQFADPLAFFRELIQNALDAGSQEIDVWTEFRPDENGPGGVYILGVDDYGEGMDREIIDNKLTRLFSSAKDGDFTKIGKFGIGFVSVFAVRPDAVVLDTSRGGESWRVVFKKDRSFTRIARDTPVDGTKIQVIKAATRDEYEDVAVRARETVVYWCKHVSAEIRFNDEPINQPFGLPETVCTVAHQEEGIEVTVGYRRDGQAFFGFYNKGLTLIEGSEGFFPGLAFKVSSRFLEHTLTRDNVVRDVHFDSAMEQVHRLAKENLNESLFARVDHLLRNGGSKRDLEAAWYTLASVLTREPDQEPQKPDECAVARDVNGKLVTWKALKKAASSEDRIFWEHEATALARQVYSDKRLVLQASGSDEAVLALVEVLAGDERPRVASAFFRPLPAKGDDLVERWESLAAGVGSLLKEHGVKFGSVELAHFDYPSSSLGERIAVLVKALGEPTRWTDHADAPCEEWGRKDVVVVNADHASVAPLIELSEREPEFAAYTLLKLVLLGHERLSVAEDGRLATRAVEQRCRRLKISLES